MIPLKEFHNRKNQHCAVTCGIDYIKYIGIKGDYELIEKSDKKDNKGQWLYRVKCKLCKNEKLLNSYNIQNNSYYHNFLNCGENVYYEEINNIYGDYKIIEYVGKRENHPLYLCECIICKRTKVVQLENMKNNVGISHQDCIYLVENNIYKKKLKSKWENMRFRTTNPKCHNYNLYGGRGINSNEFEYFIDFL